MFIHELMITLSYFLSNIKLKRMIIKTYQQLTKYVKYDILNIISVINAL